MHRIHTQTRTVGGITMMEFLEKIVNTFNEKLENSEKMTEKLKDINRTIQIELDEKVFYHMRMVGGKIVEVIPDSVKEPELPDLRVVMDSITFEGIRDGTVKPLKAFALKKIKVIGSFKDKILLKDLASALKKKKKEE